MKHLNCRNVLLLVCLAALALTLSPGCEAGDPSGCSNSDDCPDGQSCYGPAQCGAVWTCQSEYPPCSAAPPFYGCGCEGTVMEFAAGCPDRHAYSIDAFTSIKIVGGSDWTGYGAPCDPDRKSPFQVKVAIAGTDLDPVEGSVFWLRRSDGTTPAWAPASGLPIASGAMSFLSSEFEHEYGDPYFLGALIDKNGDGLCDPVDDIVFKPEPAVDLTDFVIHFDITPASWTGNSLWDCTSWQ